MSINKDDLTYLRSTLQTLVVTVDGLLKKIDKPSEHKEPHLSAEDKRRLEAFRDRIKDNPVISEYELPPCALWMDRVGNICRIPKEVISSKSHNCEASGNRNQIRVIGTVCNGVFHDDEFLVVGEGALYECNIRTAGSVHNTAMSRCVIDEHGHVVIHGSRATADDIYVGRGGTLKVMDSATVKICCVYGGGNLSAASACVEDLTVLAGGTAFINSAGQLNRATVSSGGVLTLDGGNVTQRIKGSNGCCITLARGSADVLSCTGEYSKLTVGNDAKVRHLSVYEGDVKLCGEIQMLSMNKAYFTTFAGLDVQSAILDTTEGYINSGVHFNRCVAREGANIKISNGATVSELATDGHCTIACVSRGGFVDHCEVSCEATVRVDGHVNRMQVHGPSSFAKICKGGTVNSLILFSWATVDSGVASSVELYSSSHLTVSAGGRVNNMHMKDGTLIVESGGVVERVVLSGGQINVSSGGICKVEQLGGSIETLRGGYSYVCGVKEKK